MGWFIIGRRARRHNGTTQALWQVVTKTYCVVIYLSRLVRTALTRIQVRAGDRFSYQFGEVEGWGLAGEVPPAEILQKVKGSHLAASSTYQGLPHGAKGVIFCSTAHFAYSSAVSGTIMVKSVPQGPGEQIWAFWYQC